MLAAGHRTCTGCAHLASHWAPRPLAGRAVSHRSADRRRSVKMDAGTAPPPEERNDNVSLDAKLAAGL